MVSVARLQSVFFGSGSPMSISAFHTLCEVSDVNCVIVPERRDSIRGIARRLLRRDEPLSRAAREAGIAVLPWVSVEEKLHHYDADLLCVATFPFRISERSLGLAKLGALNLHGSVLPRHRGPDPLFWTYFDHDPTAGVTLHWMDDEFDAGDIVAQREWDLPQGTRATDVYGRQMTEGCAMLREALQALSSGYTLTRTRQNAVVATRDPSPGLRTWRIDFDHWPLGRVWHFLYGLSPVYNDLLTLNGAPLHITADLRCSRQAHDERAGKIVVHERSFRLYCNGGVIEGALAPRLSVRQSVSTWLRG